LRRNPEFDNGEAELFLFPDQIDEGQWKSIKALLDDFNFPKASLMPASTKRLYSDRNVIRARNWVFDNTYCDFAYGLDSDIVVTPQAIGLLKRAYDWSKQFGEFVLHHNIAFVGNMALKERQADRMNLGVSTGTNHFISRYAWNVIRPTLDHYFTRFAVPHAERDSRGIRQWFAELARNAKDLPDYSLDDYLSGSCGTGNDAATQVAIAATGLRAAHLRVNRAITIGSVGENTSPDKFAAFANVKLDDIGSDSQLSQFKWHHQTP
jgi:hypothetical protein